MRTSEYTSGQLATLRRRAVQGQGAVEFALLLGLIMLLAMGIVDFARAFFVQETLQQAASDGARRAAVCQLRDTANPPTVTTSIDHAVYRSLANLGWSNLTLTVAYESGSANVGRQVTLTTAYSYDFITPVAGPIMQGVLGGSPTLTGRATSTVEQVASSC